MMANWKQATVAPTLLASILFIPIPEASGGEFLVGGASVSITPDRPIALAGQMHTRVARSVESPVTATAVALESRDGATSSDQAILVSCDLVAIDESILVRVRKALAGREPGLDAAKIILSATHTHTAPVVREGDYEIPKDGVMQPGEYLEFLVERLVTVAAEAWKARKPGKVGWGLGHAVVARNRRSVYADGRAVMYGATDKPDFRAIEGPEDQGVQVLCFWDRDDRLIATAINVAVPSQEVEGLSVVNADFWHEIRESLRARHGKDLLVLGWTGAAGDQSPHLMYRKRAEERMRALRGLTRNQELARRVVAGWEEAFEGARKEPHGDTALVHKVAKIELPRRLVTESEAAAARAKVEALSKDPRNRRLVLWHGNVVERFEQQKAGTLEPFVMDLHVIRLGDVAITTNVFELYTDYGIQIQARSRALQTFVIQLAGPGSYLPTERAVKGGGYSAIAESNLVGPEGGQVLVDKTLQIVDILWTTK